MKLVTLAHLEGFYYKARVDKGAAAAIPWGADCPFELPQGRNRHPAHAEPGGGGPQGGSEYAEFSARAISIWNFRPTARAPVPSSIRPWPGWDANSTCPWSPPTIATSCARPTPGPRDPPLHPDRQTVLDEKRLKFQTEELYFKPPKRCFANSRTSPRPSKIP